MEKLKKIISMIAHKSYKAYKQLRGNYDFKNFTLYIDYVQGDPFASPSKFRIRVLQAKAKFTSELFSNKSRKTALEDYISRAFDTSIKKEARGNRGTGNSGMVTIDSGKQEIIQRTSCVVKQFIKSL